MLRRTIANAASYDATLQNLILTPTTRVIYQGFTGKAATVNAQATIQYGTRVVGGVTPGRIGRHLGLPLLPTMKKAARILKPDATAIFVAAPYCAAAIEEAVEAEIPLIVAVAEHVPVHEMLRVHSMLQTQSRSRLVGANCPGIINPAAHCRVGFVPHSSFLPGVVGIVAKSGTLSYEAVDATTKAGLGQSMVIGMGGDWVAGTTLTEGVRVFLQDEKTEGIVIIGEIGGDVELEVAYLLKNWEGKKKQVMALVAGELEVSGTVMGHAGAIRVLGDVDAKAKRKALEDAGVTVVTHPGQFGDGMLNLLGKKRPQVPVEGMGPGPQKFPKLTRDVHTERDSSAFFKGQVAAKMSSMHADLPLVDEGTPEFFISISIDRFARQPCLTVTHLSQTDTKGLSPTFASFPFSYGTGPDRPAIKSALYALNNTLTQPQLLQLKSYIEAAWTAYVNLRCYVLTLPFTSDHKIPTNHLSILLDPASVPSYDPGLIYIRLGGSGTIGTLVNGAGLAMNTLDALQHFGGTPTNFLDTGGKATKDSVKDAMATVLADDRVKVVFVNIFGGLTDCEMIAHGVVAAMVELELGTPVVIRLRGTNENEGLKVLGDSMLPLHPFQDFEEAVKKAVALGS